MDYNQTKCTTFKATRAVVSTRLHTRVLLKGVCMPIVEFFVNVLSTPAILVGLVALLGLALQGKPVEDLIRGTLKTIVGFLVLSAGDP